MERLFERRDAETDRVFRLRWEHEINCPAHGAFRHCYSENDTASVQ